MAAYFLTIISVKKIMIQGVTNIKMEYRPRHLLERLQLIGTLLVKFPIALIPSM